MIIALILSGGTGSRLGADIPKQYIKVAEKPVFGYCLDVFQKNALVDKIHIVAEKEWQSIISQYCDSNGVYKFCGFSLPGATRQISILNGIENIKDFADKEDLVIIHDAARPLIYDKLISDCLKAVNGYDGVLPVLPMKDTVYYSDDGKSVSRLLERKCLYAGQSPEVFKIYKYYEANLRLLPDEILNINGSTEPAVLAGMNIAMIDGDERNFKITTRVDLERFKETIKKNDLLI